jgi:hypothetical protein
MSEMQRKKGGGGKPRSSKQLEEKDNKWGQWSKEQREGYAIMQDPDRRDSMEEIEEEDIARSKYY